MVTREELVLFWNGTKEELALTDPNVTLQEEPDLSGREFLTYRLTMDSYQGRRIRAWYSVPKDSPPGRKLPAILAVPGYGGQKSIPTQLVLDGFAVLTLYPRGQGESCLEWELESGTKLTYQITDRDKYYYRAPTWTVCGVWTFCRAGTRSMASGWACGAVARAAA